VTTLDPRSTSRVDGWILHFVQLARISSLISGEVLTELFVHGEDAILLACLSKKRDCRGSPGTVVCIAGEHAICSRLTSYDIMDSDVLHTLIT
jgi:hypothetical protein